MRNLNQGLIVHCCWLAAILTLAAPTGARALCLYNGKHFTKSVAPEFDGRLYAKTTLTDEFQDAALVVKSTFLSNRNLESHNRNEDSGVVYRVRVDQTFKGSAPRTLLIYSNRDSGSFYLGEGGKSSEYLLFLDPLARGHWANKLVPGAYEVNYSCGQSQEWRKVSPDDKAQLANLAREKH
jgi:hypothetical protein